MVINGIIIWSIIFFIMGFIYLYIYLFKDKRKTYIAIIFSYFAWCYALLGLRHNVDKSIINILILSILFSMSIFLTYRDMYQHH